MEGVDVEEEVLCGDEVWAVEPGIEGSRGPEESVRFGSRGEAAGGVGGVGKMVGDVPGAVFVVEYVAVVGIR